MLRTRLLTIIAALALIVTPSGDIQADSEAATESLLSFAQIAGVLQGFNPRGEIWRGQLTPGEWTLITENLAAGNEYLILAASDASTSNIDLELFDEELNLIDADYGEDNTPLVSITPISSGTYYLRVTLITAQAPAAWYALQVMYR